MQRPGVRAERSPARFPPARAAATTVISTGWAVLDVVVGIVLVVTGVGAATRRRSSRVGALLAVTGLCWFVGSLISPLVLLHRGPLVHVHLTYPTGRPHRPRTRVVIAIAYAAARSEEHTSE